MKIGSIIASNQVAKEHRRVGYLYREEPDNENDSGWRVFSGEETQNYADDGNNFAMYNASTILQIDPSIRELLSKPAPVAFERNSFGVFIQIEA